MLVYISFQDRLAALVAMIRRSPIHAMNELESLVSLLQTNIQHRREALTVAEVLEDIFINTYLPDDRRLIFIDQQPTQPNTKIGAILDLVEDKVKHLYGKFLDLLQVNHPSIISLSLSHSLSHSSKSLMILLVLYA